jgi:hypothetical protein
MESEPEALDLPEAATKRLNRISLLARDKPVGKYFPLGERLGLLVVE